MTKKNLFESVIAIIAASESADKVELIAGLQHEIDLLDKKAASPKKPTARQKENVELSARVLSVLNDTPLTVSDIIAKLGDNTLSNQRITHILTALTTDGKAVRTVVKRKAFYTMNADRADGIHFCDAEDDIAG